MSSMGIILTLTKAHSKYNPNLIPEYVLRKDGRLFIRYINPEDFKVVQTVNIEKIAKNFTEELFSELDRYYSLSTSGLKVDFYDTILSTLYSQFDIERYKGTFNKYADMQMQGMEFKTPFDKRMYKVNILADNIPYLTLLTGAFGIDEEIQKLLQNMRIALRPVSTQILELGERFFIDTSKRQVQFSGTEHYISIGIDFDRTSSVPVAFHTINELEIKDNNTEKLYETLMSISAGSRLLQQLTEVPKRKRNKEQIKKELLSKYGTEFTGDIYISSPEKIKNGFLLDVGAKIHNIFFDDNVEQLNNTIDEIKDYFTKNSIDSSKMFLSSLDRELFNSDYVKLMINNLYFKDKPSLDRFINKYGSDINKYVSKQDLGVRFVDVLKVVPTSLVTSISSPEEFFKTSRAMFFFKDKKLFTRRGEYLLEKSYYFNDGLILGLIKQVDEEFYRLIKKHSEKIPDKIV